jgi:hypothetical protein
VSFHLGDVVRLFKASSDPTGAEAELSWRTDTKKVRVHDGTSWADLATTAAPGGARVTKTGHSVANAGAGAAITFTTESYDTGTVHDAVSNTSRLVAPTTGVYLATGNVTWPTSVNGGARAIWIQESGGGTRIAQVEYAAVPAGTMGQNLAMLHRLTAGQYLELFAYQNQSGGAALSVDAIFAMTLIPGSS